MPRWSTWAEINTAVTNREGAAYVGAAINTAYSNHPSFHNPCGLTNALASYWVDYTLATGGNLAQLLQTNADTFTYFDGGRLTALGVTNIQTNAVIVTTKNAKDWRALLELMRTVEFNVHNFSNAYWWGFSDYGVTGSWANAKALAVSNAVFVCVYPDPPGSFSGTQADTNIFGDVTSSAWYQRQAYYLAPGVPFEASSNLAGVVDLYAASSAFPYWTFTNFYNYGDSTIATNWQRVASQTGTVANMVFTFGSATNAPEWGADGTGRGYVPRFKLLFRGLWNP